MNKMIDYPLSVKTWDADGTFSGYASVFGITDSQGEEVASGAFDISLKEWERSGKKPKLLWQHDCRQPIGLWQEIREDTHGLYVKGQLILELSQGREAYSLLKNGVVDSLSIGFLTVRARRKEGKNGAIKLRVLEEVILQEVSLVTFAANPLAKVDRVKRNDPEIINLKNQLVRLTELLNN
ncbi:MAG: HK97 family phage prohead protease [Alphaproteobacteria bacterium]|nr:HK97 family phage prohead protease [Alphaproteobacteria bacterium]